MGDLNLEITDSLFFGKYIMEGFAARYETFWGVFKAQIALHTSHNIVVA